MPDSNISVDLHPSLAAATQKFRQWWNDRQNAADRDDRPVGPLYHYTSASGLRGIIDSGTMWFSDVLQLNDTSEYQFGAGIAIDELAKNLSPQTEPFICNFCKNVIDELHSIRKRQTFVYYVGCFTSKRNDLNHWRAYGDNGRGFALGLAPALFYISDVVPTAPNERVFVAKVSYGKEKAQNQQRTVIDYALSIIRQTLQNVPVMASNEETKRHLVRFLMAMAVELTSSILWHCLTCKHDAYESESEVRLLLVHAPGGNELPIETRARKSELVSVVKYPLRLREPGTIQEIVTGPSVSEISIRGARHLVRSLDLNPEDVLKESGIPYRAS